MFKQAAIQACLVKGTSFRSSAMTPRTQDPMNWVQCVCKALAVYAHCAYVRVSFGDRVCDFLQILKDLRIETHSSRAAFLILSAVDI